VNPLQELEQHGQSVWLDSIRRSMFTSGELSRLIAEDGVRGLTSNPTIFQKAVTAGTDYDAQVRDLVLHQPDLSVRDLYDRVVIADIQMAADALRPVYEATSGLDGYVSLEVPPPVAHDTEATVAEARQYWRAVNRPNLLIKIPATAEGLPAIETCLSEGININITLMFSLAHYEAVAEAYLRAVSRLEDPSRLASVASFFVSRVDTKADTRLKEIGSPEALGLLGKIAVANSKVTYRRFEEIFHGERFADLRRRGARVQRCLWASTSTKNPAYSDTLYVDNLIGPETVNTLPLETLLAFRAHGQAAPLLQQGVEEAETDLQRLAALGIDLLQMGEELQVEGVRLFGESYDQLLAALEEKRRRIAAGEETS
jgi:transaldolase